MAPGTPANMMSPYFQKSHNMYFLSFLEKNNFEVLMPGLFKLYTTSWIVFYAIYIVLNSSTMYVVPMEELE